MAYYCKECATWLSSDDARMDYHNGRLVVHRYCDYDRKYRAEDQDIFRCGGFVYVRRSIITMICDILKIDKEALFNAFDEVKEEKLIPTCDQRFDDYNTVGPVIAKKMSLDPNRQIIARNMLNGFIIPAEASVKMGNYEEAVSIYEKMVRMLAYIYHASKEEIENKNQFSNLVKVRI